MKLILHIGINKTGSTSIQNALWGNAAALKRAAVLYPEAGMGERGGGYGYHYNLSRSLGFANVPADPAGEAEMLAKIRRELDNEIIESKCDKLVISSEYFSLKRNMRRAENFFSDFDVTVIVYLRRHDDWYASQYYQALRTIPGDLPWKNYGFGGYLEWVKTNPGVYTKYSELLRAWESVAPRDRIIIRPFDKIVAQGGIVQDFFQASGLIEVVQMGPDGVRHDNKSPPQKSIIDLEIRRRAEMGEDASSMSALSEFLNADLRRNIYEENEDDYSEIYKRYMPESDGALFEAPRE